jgi:hypothetical protein
MADLIDITSSILSQNTICFDIRNINTEHIPVPIKDAKFGILNFIAITTGETSDELDFLFSVDCSGSMSDICSDGKSKMQHINHTLKNMIMFFHKHPDVKINVKINAFDTFIYNIVTRTIITDENLSEIMFKIDKIIPRGSTNIENALNSAASEIANLQTQFPNNIINHIFMTDGEATDGSKDIEHLRSIVNPNVVNVFIGFGVKHDDALLNGISSLQKSAYYFIDKLESAGLVYGEILHGIIYKLLTNSEVLVENGFIYDYKNNNWVQLLKIGDIVSEANKTYNIISSDPDKCRVNIKANMSSLLVLFPSTLIETIDLSVHLYRQRTLQLIYEVNEFCKRKQNNDETNNTIFQMIFVPRNNDPLHEEENKLKEKLTNFMEEIKKFMIDNNLNDNKILKNLCDDIYICYRTLGTKFGTMFCTARQTSQGTQRQYTASHTITTDDLSGNSNRTFRRNFARAPGIPVLQRESNNISNDDGDFDPFHDDINAIDLPIMDHIVSDFGDTPYLTPQATQVMREISRSVNDLEDLDDDISM